MDTDTLARLLAAEFRVSTDVCRFAAIEVRNYIRDSWRTECPTRVALLTRLALLSNVEHERPAWATCGIRDVVNNGNGKRKL